MLNQREGNYSTVQKLGESWTVAVNMLDENCELRYLTKTSFSS